MERTFVGYVGKGCGRLADSLKSINGIELK